MASAIKLYMDEQVDPDVAKGLRRYGIDVLTSQQVGMLRATDPEQLAFAISQGRAIFTQDTDFLKMAASNTTHLGIIFARQGAPIGKLIEELRTVVEAGDQEELINISPWFLHI